MSDTIRIEDLAVDCVVGVYPHERDVLQPLRVDLELTLDTERAAKSERVSESVNYHLVASQVVFLLQSGRFRLLETAAHVIAKTLLCPPAPGEHRAAIDAVTICLKKPSALRGAAVPSLVISRTKDWNELTHEEKQFGTVDVIHESTEAGIYRLHIAGGAGIPLHAHQKMRESEMVLGDQLMVNHQRVRAGTVHRWPLGAKHRYDNPSKSIQTILCVDSPPFDPADEIVVAGSPDSIAPEPFWGIPSA